MRPTWLPFLATCGLLVSQALAFQSSCVISRSSPPRLHINFHPKTQNGRGTFSSTPSLLASELESVEFETSRRLALTQVASNLVFLSSANAAVTDETDTFADNWWTTPTANDKAFAPSQLPAKSGPSDEVTIAVPKASLNQKKGGGGLGVELGEVEFRTNIRVYVVEYSLLEG